MINRITYFLTLSAILVLKLDASECTEKIFNTLYEMKVWGKDGAGNGSGSLYGVEVDIPCAYFLNNFIQTNQIKSIVDAGCGDGAFFKSGGEKTVDYIGIDIVRSVIERNQKNYNLPKITFICGDINEMELPKADLLICKDVLQNLSNQDVKHFINRCEDYKYCLFINDALPKDKKFNRSIVCGDHRPLDLSKPPFSLKGAKVFSYKAGPVDKEVFLKINSDDQPTIHKKKHFVINSIHPYQGFFSVFLTVINYLDLYDLKDIDGLTVNFGSNGLFYQADRGSNWWSYYFEPISLGDQQNAELEYSAANETGRVAYLAEMGLPRERLAELVKKYVVVKPEIIAERDQFTNEKFGDKYVIGVHYRGTDKSCEANSITYEVVSNEVQSQIISRQLNDYVIFVASDENGFIEHMKKMFEGKVVSSDCLRSMDKNPVHYFNANNTSPYKTGKEALMDCLILSKCHHLIRTSSCLSLVSSYFNPAITETILSQRNTHCYSRF